MFKKLTLSLFFFSSWFSFLGVPFLIKIDLANPVPIPAISTYTGLFFIAFVGYEPDLKIKKECIKFWKRFWLNSRVVIFTILLHGLSLFLISLIWNNESVRSSNWLSEFILSTVWDPTFGEVGDFCAAVILCLLFKQRQNRINKIIRIFQENDDDIHEELIKNIHSLS